MHLRYIRFLFIALLLCAANAAGAQNVWDGKTKAQPAGTGTEEDPYLIETGANLYWVQQNISETFDKHLRQTADIDMGGHAFNPANGDKPRGIGSFMYPFEGVYDGDGYEIKNLDIPIKDVGDGNKLLYGVFGYVKGGTLRNIVLNNIKVHFTYNPNNSGGDLRVGALVGFVGENSVIENIIVKGSSITDGGIPLSIHSLFCGGVIGEIQKEIGSGDLNHKPITVKNIYAEVDIDLGNVVRGKKDTKHYNNSVGGIVGRGRLLKKGAMPENTFYKGKINAPWFFVSPLWGTFRTMDNVDANNKLYYRASTAYSGEYDNKNGNYYLNSLEDNKTRYFYGYELMVDGEYKEVNDTYPENVHEKTQVRTVDPLTTDPANGFDPYDPTKLRQVQGVNHANYINLEEKAGRTELLEMLNGYAGSRLLNWGLSGSEAYFRVKITAERVAFDRLVAKVSGINHPEEGSVKWKLQLNDGSYIEVAGKTMYDDPTTFELILSDTHPDLVKSAIAYLEIDGEVKAQSEPIMFYDEKVKIYRSGLNKFEAQTEEHAFSDENTLYIYEWWADYGDGYVNEGKSAGPVHSDIRIFDTLPNQVKVTLWTDKGERITTKDGSGEQIYAELPIVDIFISRDCKLTAEMVEVGDSYIPVAYVTSPDGEMVAGGHPSANPYVSNSNATYIWETTDNPGDPDSWKPDYEEGKSLRSWGSENNRNTFHRVIWYAHDFKMDTVYVSMRRLVFVYNKEHTKKALAKKVAVNLDNNKYPDGDDSNHGSDPYHAVRTLKKAYSLLQSENSLNDNIIVVMGYLADTECWSNDYSDAEHERIMSKCASIQGAFGNTDFGGTLLLSKFDTFEVYCLRGATLFRNITWDGGNKMGRDFNKGLGYELYLYCNLHDLTIDEGVKVSGYKTMGANSMGLGKDSAPFITITGGYHNYNKAYNSHEDRLKYPETNSEPGVTTITIHSGCFGRIISAARNNGALNSNSLNVFGHPKNPHRVKVNVAIEHHLTGDAKRKEYCDVDYVHDIGLLVGGQTDGSVFTDSRITMTGGSVGRFIAGNISYGRKAQSGNRRASSDGFYGSSVLDLHAGEIHELIGGTLGRLSESISDKYYKAEIYFYGRSIINIGDPGGDDSAITIGGNIYGAGAGGVTGLGTDIDKWHHTDDKLIPYQKEGDDVTVLYGDYDAVRKFGTIKMDLLDKTQLDLGDSYSEVNVMSGTIKGDIFGGGLGFSEQFHIDNVNNNDRASDHAGNLYGRSTVRISGGLIEGSVYGGGAGDDRFITDRPAGGTTDFERVACLYGTSTVDISGGVIQKDVYAGSKGIRKHPLMAAIYGTSTLNVSGGTVYGNIYGGSELASTYKQELTEAEAMSMGTYTKDGEKYYLKDTGSTYVNISGGVIGNDIFGGSRGEVASDTDPEMEDLKSTIAGDTHLNISGGEFLAYPYMQLGLTDDEAVANGWDVVSTPENYRTFNIYGGGNLNCDILGTSYLNIGSSLLVNEKSFVPRSQNPNGLTEHIKSESFQSAYMDITFRRFCVYGGGFGPKTNVLNTDVRVNVRHDDIDVPPHGLTLESPLPRQSFFDISGGGYSGDVGYWATATGEHSANIDVTGLTADEVVANYHHYVGGNCKVTIDGNTFARKVFGGGFYGSCRTTNTNVIGGSLRQVYGGSLLGYVYDRAELKLGNRIEDFIREDGSGFSFQKEPEEVAPWEGDITKVPADVYALAAQEAEQRNNNIFITENIYGGNDVKGIIGTRFWTGPNNEYGIDPTDNGPLFCSYIPEDQAKESELNLEEKGINFNIFGGTYMANVYGAGNGHYRGYFVPEAVRYNDGPARMYRSVISSKDPTKKAKAYRSRPMVGNVNINIRGNSATDKVHLLGDFFGGGSECTIGEFNTILPLEDPRRLAHGGWLHVNFGGFVDVEGNVYLGNEGEHIAQQYTVPSGIELNGFDYSTTESLHKLDRLAYSHWYFDTDANYYKPGFPMPGKVDGNYGLTGVHMFYSFIQNVMMEGDVELTFYRDLYERNEDGTLVKDKRGKNVRKRWVPGELAMSEYDAKEVKMNSFFLGGLSGTMSNNNVMQYCYDHHAIFDPTTSEKHTNVEERGSIYRVSLPAGVTIRDKVVMGSENARAEYYEYNDGCTEVIKTKTDADGKAVQADPVYVFDGGIITQNLMTFDLMVYNAEQNKGKTAQESLVTRFFPDDYYSNEEYKSLQGMDSYTFADDYFDSDFRGKTIYRKKYPQEAVNKTVHGDPRYDLAVDENGAGVIGQRLTRSSLKTDVLSTVSKLTASCAFDLVDVEPENKEDASLKGTPSYLYGGNIYGGCYHSGLVIGDVVMNIGSDLLGSHECFKDNGAANFGDWSSMKYNIGRVFGGGFGDETTIIGDTYVNLLRNFRGMNVFGGGMEGHVEGTSHINYIGDEERSYIFGSIYGGGLMGNVGNNVRSAVVRLYSGNVNSVYGGSCMGHMFGRTFVEVVDEPTVTLDYLDLDRLLKQQADALESLGYSRLIAGSVYGGNDIAGTITNDYPDVLPTDDITPDSIDKLFSNYNTGIYVGIFRKYLTNYLSMS